MLIGFLAVLLITPTLITAIVLSLDLERLRGELALALSERVGLEVALRGRISVAPGLRPAVRARSIAITNRSWGTERPLARVESVVFEFELWQSLRERRLVLRYLAVEGVALRLHRNSEGIGNWVVDRATRPGAAAGTSSVLRLDLDALEVSGLDFQYESAISEARFELDFESIRFENATSESPQRIRGHGRFRGQALELDAQLGASGDRADIVLLAPGEKSLDARLSIGDARLRATGALRDLRGAARARLEIGLELPDLEMLTYWRDSPLANALESPGPLTANARLIGEAGRVGLEAIDVRLALDETTRLRVRGELSDLPRLSGFDLAIELMSEDLRQLISALGRGPRGRVVLRAAGRLVDREAALHLEALRAEFRHENGIGLDVSGAASRSETGLKLDLATIVTATRLGDLFDLFPEQLGRLAESSGAPESSNAPESASAPAGAEAPARDVLRAWLRELGPVRAEGRIHGPSDAARIDLVEFLAGDREQSWLEASGRVEAVVPRFEGLELEVSVGSVEVRSLVDGFGAASLGLDRLSGQGELRSSSSGIGLYEAQLLGTTLDGTRIELNADRFDFDEVGQATLTAAFASPSFSDLGDALGRAWPPTGAVSGRALLSMGRDDWQARDLEIVVGGTRLAGELGVGVADTGRRQVWASLASDRLEVADFRGPQTIEPPAATPPAAGLFARIREYTIPSNRAGESAEEIDFDLDLTLGELVAAGGASLRDVSLSLRRRDTELLVREVALGWKGGRVAAVGHVDSASSPPRVVLDLHARDLDLGRLLERESRANAWSGRLEIRLDLVAEGERVGDLLSSMRGDVFVYAREGRIARRYARALELDLASSVGVARSGPEDEAYECMIVDLRASNGKLTIGDMLLDTEHEQILGAGYLDLPSETLDIVLTPVLKQTTSGNVSASVRVTGPIDDPKTRVEALATAESATRGLVRRALRPLRTFLPGVAEALGDVSQTAEGVASVAIPSRLWRPGVDVSCQQILAQERVIRARSSPLSDARSRPSARTAP